MKLGVVNVTVLHSKRTSKGLYFLCNSISAELWLQYSQHGYLGLLTKEVALVCEATVVLVFTTCRH